MARVWTDLKLPADLLDLLRAALPDDTLLLARRPQESNLTSGGPDPLLATAHIAFGQPDPQTLLDSPDLRWVHLSTAGYERYDRPDWLDRLRSRGVSLTRSSRVYDEPCAHHALAMILAAARRLGDALANQFTAQAWPAGPIRSGSRMLRGAFFLIAGFGSIGRRLAALLAPFDARIVGLRRSPSPDDPVQTRPLADVDRLLPQADFIVNLLPGGEATRGYFSASRLALARNDVIFINIGRGSTVDQSALADRLASNPLMQAWLDVTDPEPLPPQHPLWGLPNCFITPHTAGGLGTERRRLIEHFLENRRRFARGEDLLDRVV